MRIFAADTASFPASAAFLQDGVIMGGCVIRAMRKHSQHIMKMTENMFESLSADICGTDVFAVTIGPGSFTGLRIGIATVRALAQAAGKPCVGVGTLETLAYNFAVTDTVIVPMLDARRDEVFTAAYLNRDGAEPEELLAPCVMTTDEICAKFSFERKVIFAGDGMIAHRDRIHELAANAVFAPPHLSETNAAALAALAEIKVKAGKTTDYNGLVPMYLRKSQAEREADKKAANRQGAKGDCD